MSYISITAPDINNGLGFRVTLWVSGCTHNCPGCHNKWTHDYKLGKDLNEAWDEVAKWLSKEYIKGLTLSGGDPLDQSNVSLAQLENFLKRVKTEFPDKDIWIYSGCIYENMIKSQKKVLQYCDILVDGPYIESQRNLSLAFRGSENQRIIDLHEQSKKSSYWDRVKEWFKK